QCSVDGLLGRVERGRAALLEVAEAKNACAQLCEPACFTQRQPAHHLGRFPLAAGLDLAPIVLAAPLPVRPMLHLVGPLCLHRRITPTSRAKGCAGKTRFWRQSDLPW